MGHRFVFDPPCRDTFKKFPMLFLPGNICDRRRIFRVDTRPHVTFITASIQDIGNVSQLLPNSKERRCAHMTWSELLKITPYPGLSLLLLFMSISVLLYFARRPLRAGLLHAIPCTGPAAWARYPCQSVIARYCSSRAARRRGTQPGPWDNYDFFTPILTK